MTIDKLAKLKDAMDKEAHKWVSYLDTLPKRADRERELSRKLLETFLEGRLSR